MGSFEIAHSSVQGIPLMGFVPEHLRLYLKCFCFFFVCLFVLQLCYDSQLDRFASR